MSKRRGSGEGTLYKRQDGRWEAAISLGNGKRKRLYGKTQREVQEKKVAALNSLRQGLPLPGTRLTLGEFLESCWSRSSTPSGLRHSARTARRFRTISSPPSATSPSLG